MTLIIMEICHQYRSVPVLPEQAHVFLHRYFCVTAHASRFHAVVAVVMVVLVNMTGVHNTASRKFVTLILNTYFNYLRQKVLPSVVFVDWLVGLFGWFVNRLFVNIRPLAAMTFERRGGGGGRAALRAAGGGCAKRALFLAIIYMYNTQHKL